VDAVAAGRAVGPTSWDGYAATAVAEAAVLSSAKGQRVEVRLADKPALYA
jgi:myo-inositol 2-dehydrogenase/D-chiro-inositol 1-dehydrogenase